MTKSIMNKKYTEYLKAQEAKRRSKSTMDLMTTTLSNFPTPSKLNKEWFLERQTTKGIRTKRLIAPATLRYELGLAKRFLTWAGMDITVLPKTSDLPKVKRSLEVSDLYTPEEFMLIMGALRNPRDKAMIHVLWESGMRAGEVLSMTIENLDFKENECIVTVSGKTGTGRFPLLESVPALKIYLNNHPVGKGALWVNERGTCAPLGYKTLYIIVSRALKRAGIVGKKRIVHTFRHSRLTIWGNDSNITDAQRKQLARLSPNSTVLNNYTHLTDSDAFDALRKGRGQIPRDNGSVLTPNIISCPGCETVNPPDANICTECNTPLRGSLLKEALQRVQQTEDLIQRIGELENKVNELEYERIQRALEEED